MCIQAKHFINDPTELVAKALRAIPRSNPAVCVDEENKIVYLPSNGSKQVSVASGGGSGHEPSFTSFVGHGMLSAAIAGTVFASPSAEQIRRCILQRVDSSQGVLVIIMNYTGDVLNFGMAVEKAKAAGLKCEMLIIGDDVGVGRKKGGKVGRRGIAGTVLVQKIAGALAGCGHTLEEIHGIASQAASSLVSIGASLEHVHVPGRAPIKESSISSGEVEIGMGIHNEEGSGKVKTDLPGLVKTMLAQLLDTNDTDRAFIDIKPNDDVILMINNFGGISPLELSGITYEVCTQLEDYKLNSKRVLVGMYMTSLNGMGFSISIMKEFDTGSKSLLELLDAPVAATGWSDALPASVWSNGAHQSSEVKSARDDTKSCNLYVKPEVVKKILITGLNSLIAAEPKITEYDTVAGDGDCGTTLKRGAGGCLQYLNTNELPSDPAILISHLAHVIESSMDGTSGALYTIFLTSLSASFSSLFPASSSSESLKIPHLASALDLSLQTLSKYTPAQPGDRTLMDALHPFVQELKTTGDLRQAVEAAEKGAERTRGMEASLGRTVYVGGSEWRKVMDPGAYGLSVLLAGLCEGWGGK